MFEVDAMGKQCPIPLIMTKNSIAQNGNGKYRVLVDNEIAVQNLKKLADQFSFAYDYEKIDNTHYQVELEVFDANVVNEVELKQNDDIKCGPGLSVNSENTIVVIKSEFMGHGDEDLGKILIKGCIYAFSQLEDPPKTFIFYNSGVKLACEGSDNIVDLENLFSKGVKIFACGTCLNHYKLDDKLAVGEVSNMYDIVEMLNSAAKIIIP